MELGQRCSEAASFSVSRPASLPQHSCFSAPVSREGLTPRHISKRGSRTTTDPQFIPGRSPGG